MNKNQDIKVFMLYHKQVDYLVDDELITPIDCHDGELGNENYFWCEVSGLYNVWRSYSAPFMGITQYRRQLQFQPALSALTSDSVITMKPINVGNVFFQYGYCHNIDDLISCLDIICEKYPEYIPSIEEYILKSGKLYYSNGFVMTGENFNKYCSWLFDILFEFRKKRFSSREELEESVKGYAPDCAAYQMFIGGFLSERLLTLYIQHNFKNIIEVEYKKFEGV